jgi:putative ABC transport system ATP-binding protein
MLVRVENVSKTYRLGEQTVTAISRVNLNIEEGVFMAIAGPSGSGKSTLLNLIGCIDTPTSGRIFIGDHDVSGRTPDELARLRGRSIGFIFQTFNLLPVLSAAENVEYPLLQFRDMSLSERRQRVEHYLRIVGLADFASHRPNQLSGGQRQRVAIARALAVRPRIILADEPTANLDHKTGGRILRLMRKINRRTGATFVFSTHDKRVIDMADRRVDLEDGEIVRLGMRKGSDWGYAAERAEVPDDDDGLDDSALGDDVPRAAAPAVRPARRGSGPATQSPDAGATPRRRGRRRSRQG